MLSVATYPYLYTPSTRLYRGSAHFYNVTHLLLGTISYCLFEHIVILPFQKSQYNLDDEWLELDRLTQV